MKKRIAAEWEPAVGVMVAWPPAIPHALYQEFAKDTTLYVLVADEAAQEEAEAAFKRWKIDPEAVKFLKVPQGEDYCWPRDWGPQPIFDEEGNFSLLGPSYVLSTPFCDIGHDVPLMCASDVKDIPLEKYESDGMDDKAAGAIAAQLGVSFVKAPFAFTGGNVLGDGVNSIISTEVLLFENRFKGISDAEYLAEVAKATGMTNYSIFSDYEMFSLNHIDCLAKPLDDRRVLVLRYPQDHPHHDLVEHIANEEIAKALNSYGVPWEVVRLDTNYIHLEGQVAAYANSLILNKSIYVPMYSIPQDEIALETWRAAMPGYTVKGFEFKIEDEADMVDPHGERGAYEFCGWDPGDVLHCRSRAVWDAEMLYVRAWRPLAPIAAQDAFTVEAQVHAYSKTALADAPKLVWRVAKGEWQTVAMEQSNTVDMWRGVIPGQAAGTTVEYYVKATDESGRCECSPRVAPEGFYSYTVQV